MSDSTCASWRASPPLADADDGRQEALAVHASVLASGPSVACVTVLHLGDECSWVVQGEGAQPVHVMRLELGTTRLARTCFQHDPPSPLELEHAIEVVEDVVMPLSRILARGSGLFVSEAGLAARLLASEEPPADGGAWSLDSVESVFNRLAALGLGRPRSQDALPTDGRSVATVLILREFLHHLQFGQFVLHRFNQLGSSAS